MITEGYLNQIQVVTNYDDLVMVCVEFKSEGYYIHSVDKEIIWPCFWRAIYTVEVRKDFVFDDETCKSEFVPHNILEAL